MNLMYLTKIHEMCTCVQGLPNHFLSLTLSCEHLGRCLTFRRAHELEFMLYLNPVVLLPPVRMSSCSDPQLGGPHVNHMFFRSVGSQFYELML